MADLYKIIEELLKEKGVSGAQMSRDLGMSRSFMTELRKGRAKSVKMETAQKLADYFSVSVDYLLGNVNDPFLRVDHAGSLADINSYGYENEKTPVDTDKRPLTDEDIQFALFGGSDEITEKMFEEVKSFAAYLKQREGYNK